MDLRAFALVCTLKASPAPSSSVRLCEQLLGALREEGVEGEMARVVDHDVRPGVSTDEGDGDEWPQLRKKILAADILVLATPIWLGHLSSVSQRVLERLDAELGEEDDQGRLLTFGKVAVAAVVGNEDGAHHVSAQLYQGLVDVGFSVPPSATTYWVGEARGKVDYQDLDATPEWVARSLSAVAKNAAHLARLLKEHPYPPQ